ncbi:MAG: ribonuclease III [Actinocrinis sp.]
MTDSQTPPAVLEQRLGLPIDPPLLERALTHRSFSYENGNVPTNERLEFLGDSVLGLVVTSTLYDTHPDLPEGQLAKFRSHVVNSRALADVARTLGLGEFLRLGKGEESTGGRDKSSILADTMEALIGAVYLDHDLEAAGGLIHRLFDGLIEASAGLGAGLDWKTSLQELTAEHSLGVPQYLVTEDGPDHDKFFSARVRVADREYPPGRGRSKKVAEQIAAEHAYRAIRSVFGSAKAEPDAGAA